MSKISLAKAVVSLSAENRAGAEFFAHIAGRKHNRKVETATHILKVCGTDATRTDVIRLFKKLDDAGYGEFIKGWGEYDSRFVWGEA